MQAPLEGASPSEEEPDGPEHSLRVLTVELVKQVKSRLEETRVAIRNVRRDANDHVKKLSGLPEDDVKSGQEEIQKLTDQSIGEAEKLAEQKEESILTV